MATKNHFSNYENLFTAYTDSVSKNNSTTTTSIENELALKRNQLKTVQSEINGINYSINSHKNKVPMIDTRKSTEFLPKFLSQREQIEKELAEIKAEKNLKNN